MSVQIKLVPGDNVIEPTFGSFHVQLEDDFGTPKVKALGQFVVPPENNRPSGAYYSATTVAIRMDHAAAMQLAGKIIRIGVGEGWPLPVGISVQDETT
ncbi:MAG TPA: hypothetical protein VGF02_13540 [Pseudolabrys sp.]|jgi:hypothetical protein